MNYKMEALALNTFMFFLHINIWKRNNNAFQSWGTLIEALKGPGLPKLYHTYSKWNSFGNKFVMEGKMLAPTSICEKDIFKKNLNSDITLNIMFKH